MKRSPVLALLLGLFFTTMVHAQGWPSKPVRWIVPFPAGGASDVVSRIIGDKLAATWGQSVVLDNKPGAGGTIATADLVRSTDGHTVMIGTLGTHGVAPGLYRNLTFDYGRDLVPVALLVQTPMALVASPTLQVASVGEFISLARAAPNKYSIASPGNGTLNHFMAEMLKQTANLAMEHVPYKGSSPAHTDLIAGRTAVMFDPIAGVLPQIKQGNLKALAITHRSSLLPGVPTLAEAGLPSLEVGLWIGLFAPQSMPASAVAKLSADVVAALRAPDVVQKIEALSSQVVAMPRESFAGTYAQELARWKKAATDLQIKID